MMANMPTLDIALGRLPSFNQINGTTRNLGSLVTDTLQIDDDLADTDHQTQIAGSWLTARQNAHALLIDIQLHLVDGVVLLADLFGQLRIAFNQRHNRIVYLFLDQPTHFQQLGANFFQLGIELLGYVLLKQFFIWHGAIPG